MFIDLELSVDDTERHGETETSRLNAAALTLSPVQEKAARSSLCKIARWGIANEWAIHYTTDWRRDDWLSQPAYHLPIETDCSGWVTLMHRWAHLPDPSGWGYRAVGNSTSITAHCRQIAPKHAMPGDMVAYGPSGQDHIVLITGATSEGSVIVCSHGWEGGPSRDLQIVEQRAHRWPATWLRNPCFAMPLA